MISFFSSGGAQKPPHRTSLFMPSAHRLTQAMHLPARFAWFLFLPATQAANFLPNLNVKHGNEGCCSSSTSTSTSISAVKKKKKKKVQYKHQTAGEANIAATNRLDPAGRGEAEPATPSACITTNRFLVTRAAASHQHEAQATACFFFGFSASSHVLPFVPPFVPVLVSILVRCMKHGACTGLVSCSSLSRRLQSTVPLQGPGIH